jgi:hypothetical protein
LHPCRQILTYSIVCINLPSRLLSSWIHLSAPLEMYHQPSPISPAHLARVPDTLSVTTSTAPPFDPPPLQLHAHTLAYKPLLIGGTGMACLWSEHLEEVRKEFLSHQINLLDMVLTSASANMMPANSVTLQDTFDQPCHHTLSIFLHYGWVIKDEFHLIF